MFLEVLNFDINSVMNIQYTIFGEVGAFSLLKALALTHFENLLGTV